MSQFIPETNGFVQKAHEPSAQACSTTRESSLHVKTRILIALVLVFTAPLLAQQARLDYKVHDVGRVRQLVTNIGTLWSAVTDYPGLIYAEYPPNSREEHVGEGGIWVGGITPGNDTLVSVTTSWASSFEFYPSAARWDSIWVVGKDDTVNIPYRQRYVGVSDQDFVCRYSDYNITNIANHTPLYLDVIQTSYAWSSSPLNEIIVYTFYVIPKRTAIRKTWIAYWLDGNVGYRGQGWDFALDDYTTYYPDKHFGMSTDQAGGSDGTAYGPIGVKIIPPKNVHPDSLRWTFNWYEGGGIVTPPSRDAARYAEMASGNIMQNQQQAIGSQFIIAFGPVDLNVGDTLTFQVAEILGHGTAGALANEKTVTWLIRQNFRVPSPPPLPPLRAIMSNHQVKLIWEPLPGGVNPETYQDPYRADSSRQPFEGYRVYKSTQSATGPWALLGEYDIPGNSYGYNTGLVREYTDVGLLNNLTYYYTVTAFSKPDTAANFPSQESSLFKNSKTTVPGTAPPQSVGDVAVVPNPYRGDLAYYSYDPPWEKPAGTRDRWMEQDRRLQFINLPPQCEIKVYTIAGDLVTTISHSDPARGYEDWNLTSSVGQAVSSGIYLFTAEDTTNKKVQAGKFVVIK